MEFRTVVDIPKPGFEIEPFEEMLFVGSCFADSIGQRFVQDIEIIAPEIVPGVEVVTTGQHKLVDGVKVNVVK